MAPFKELNTIDVLNHYDNGTSSHVRLDEQFFISKRALFSTLINRLAFLHRPYHGMLLIYKDSSGRRVVFKFQRICLSDDDSYLIDPFFWMCCGDQWECDHYYALSVVVGGPNIALIMSIPWFATRKSLVVNNSVSYFNTLILSGCINSTLFINTIELFLHHLSYI